MSRRERDELLVQKGELRGQMRALRESALADPELRELVRQKAWLQHDATRVRMAPGMRVVCPEGWPPTFAAAREEAWVRYDPTGVWRGTGDAAVVPKGWPPGYPEEGAELLLMFPDLLGGEEP